MRILRRLLIVAVLARIEPAVLLGVIGAMLFKRDRHDLPGASVAGGRGVRGSRNLARARAVCILDNDAVYGNGYSMHCDHSVS